MSLASTEVWKLQSPQVAAIEEIFTQLWRNALTGASVASGFVYDGNGRLTEFTADGVLYTITYPDSLHINVVYGTHSVAVTLDAQSRVVGVVRT